MNGEVQLILVPETHAECPDCEATLDDLEANLCPTCGEGIGAEPEFVRVRPLTPEPIEYSNEIDPDDCPDFDLSELE
jgi:predicted amidophosphoribosyltransferase